MLRLTVSWRSVSKALLLTALTVLVEGDSQLVNRYHVILLNPVTHPQAKQGPARRFADWLISP
jgi:ABC-type tungstate transport system permease subunit